MITGSLQIQNDKYYAVLNIYENGKRKQKWVSTDLPVKNNKRAAGQRLKEIIEEYERGPVLTRKLERKGSGIPFVDYMKQWLETVRGTIEDNTLAAYQWMVNSRITTFFEKENPTLADFGVEHLQRFYEWLREEGLTGNTLVHYHACIRKALSQAFKTGLVLENIADKVDRPKKDKFIADFYDKQELAELFEKSKGDPLELMIFVTAYYGLRRSEVVGLKWSAIDFRNKTVTIRHKVTETKLDGKKKLIAKDRLKNPSSNRSLPLFPEVEKRLLEQKAQQEKNKKLCKTAYENSEYIFVNDLGQLIKPNYVTQHFKILLQNKGLRKIRFHDLRHSCATLLLAQGIPMKDIQEWLGHSNFSTTADLYAHLDYNSKLRSADAISGAFPEHAISDENSQKADGQAEIPA